MLGELDVQTTEARPENREAPSTTKPFMAWARRKGTPMISVDRAALMHRWPIGRHVTEAQFDAAIEAGDNVVIR